MSITAADVEAEHRAALASMTPAQWRACRRLDEARQSDRVPGLLASQAPAGHLFEHEAEARTRRAEHAEQP